MKEIKYKKYLFFLYLFKNLYLHARAIYLGL